MNTQKHEISDLDDMWDNWWHTRADWKLRFCWFPRRCELSGKSIWLDLAYCGTLVITESDVAGVEYRWHDVNEHLIWLLKS